MPRQTFHGQQPRAVGFWVALVAVLLAAASAVEGHSTPAFATSTKKWVSLKLAELNGLWYAEGDAIPKAVFERKGGLPNCKAHSGFGHTHFFGDDHAYMIYGGNSSSTAGFASVGHRRTTQYRITSMKGSTIYYRTAAAATTRCLHWRPYVDQTTGHLRAVSLFATTYTRAANGTVTSKSTTCALKGNESPACRVQSPNVVQSIGYATYTCINGECGLKAPFYQQVDAMHDH